MIKVMLVAAVLGCYVRSSALAGDTGPDSDLNALEPSACPGSSLSALPGNSCVAPLGPILPITKGTAIALRAAQAGERPSQTNTIPFRDSFETHAPNLRVSQTNGWWQPPQGWSTVVTGALNQCAGGYPITTSHERHLKLNTEGTVLFNAVTGALSHVWADMLVVFVLSEDQPDYLTNSPVPQMLLYVNATSNLVVYARRPDATQAGFLASAIRVAPYGSEARPYSCYRLSIHRYDGDAATEAWFAVHLDGFAVDWPGGAFLPGVPAQGSTGPWLRCAPGSPVGFPGIAFTGTGYIDDLVITDSHPLHPGAMQLDFGTNGALVWSSDFGRDYQMQSCTNLVNAEWQPWGTAVTGNGSTNSVSAFTDSVPQRFYRITTTL